MTVEVGWKRDRVDVTALAGPVIVRRRPSGLGWWADGRGRALWCLGVGHCHLSTVSLSTLDAAGVTSVRARGVRLSDGSFHQPAMLAEALEWLAPNRGGLFLDGTVGGAGHAQAILGSSADARLLCVDRDEEALARARQRLQGYEQRVSFARGDFAEAARLFDLGEGALAGVLLDLGVSSHQIDTTERGFSYRPGVPLDMRMSREALGATAEDLLRELGETELAEIFRDYGEERHARRLARAVVEVRKMEPLRISDDLLRVLGRARGRPVAPADAAPVFQALRIAVNDELGSLERALPELRDLLAPGGRFVVISYHSLEDRLVKRAFRDWSRDCVCPPELPVCRCRGRALGRQPIRGPLRPSADEVSDNPRARSARLRVWESGA